MNWILQLLVNAGVLLLVAKLMPAVKIKNFTTAILLALVIGILNATIGMLLRFPLNLLTLFFLEFLVKLIVTAIVIKITDKFFSGFEVKNFTTALILAVIMSIASSLLNYMISPREESNYSTPARSTESSY